MELWIRSQDKERLIKPIDFYIEETIDYVNKSSEFDIYALNFANDDIIIGTYQTKERALEVLDEIQNILKPKYILDSSSIRPGDSWVENGIIMQKYNANMEIKELSTFVYEMPAE